MRKSAKPDGGRRRAPPTPRIFLAPALQIARTRTSKSLAPGGEELVPATSLGSDIFSFSPSLRVHPANSISFGQGKTGTYHFTKSRTAPQQEGPLRKMVALYSPYQDSRQALIPVISSKGRQDGPRNDCSVWKASLTRARPTTTGKPRLAGRILLSFFRPRISSSPAKGPSTRAVGHSISRSR